MFDSGYQNPLLDKIAMITGLDKAQFADKIPKYKKLNQHQNFKMDFSFIFNDDLRGRVKDILKSNLEGIESSLGVNLREVYEQVNYEFDIDDIFKKFNL